ncbi:MAG: hypothetical protein QG602_3496 [Verrucomicrobiota bacterium]|nr:hypothetical protein [Verrucomicrobiota bacterium]
MTLETPAAPHEILAHIMAATIAMEKFHPDPHAREAGQIIAAGVGALLLSLVGEDKALDMFEACYAILNAGPLKGTGIHVTTQRKLTTDAHSTTEGVLAGLRAKGLI